MPEGPEIRREADRIGEALVGHRLVEVGFGLPRLRRYASMLAGCVVDAVDCRGKALLTRFDNGLTLYSHNQLYGRWYVRARDDLPRPALCAPRAARGARLLVLEGAAHDHDRVVERPVDLVDEHRARLSHEWGEADLPRRPQQELSFSNRR